MEQALYTLLSDDAGVTAIVGARISPLERLQGGDLPALTYRRISGVREHAYDGPTGLVDSRFQLDAWAADTTTQSGYGLAKSAIAAARQALDGYRGSVGVVRIGGIFVVDETDMTETPANAADQISRISMDLNIWHTE